MVISCCEVIRLVCQRVWEGSLPNMPFSITGVITCEDVDIKALQRGRRRDKISIKERKKQLIQFVNNVPFLPKWTTPQQAAGYLKTPYHSVNCWYRALYSLLDFSHSFSLFLRFRIFWLCWWKSEASFGELHPKRLKLTAIGSRKMRIGGWLCQDKRGQMHPGFCIRSLSSGILSKYRSWLMKTEKNLVT